MNGIQNKQTRSPSSLSKRWKNSPNGQGPNLLEGSLLSRIGDRRQHTLNHKPGFIDETHPKNGTSSKQVAFYLARKEEDAGGRHTDSSMLQEAAEAGGTTLAKDGTGQQTNTAVLSPVEQAIDIVGKLKVLRREDRLAGVPKQFSFDKATGVKIIDDDKKPRRIEKTKQTVRSDAADRSSASGSISRTSSRRTCLTVTSSRSRDDRSQSTASKQNSVRRHIPGCYQFPKVADFIPIERSNTVDKAGFGWNRGPTTLSLPGNTTSITDQDKPRPTSPHKGQLHRSAYPVTEALHREGMSVTKRKGAVLQDINVTKVWLRTLNQETANQLVPINVTQDAEHIPPVTRDTRRLVSKSPNNNVTTQ